MNLDSIYSQLVLEHNQDTRNRRILENPDLIERGHNPSCGDDITILLKIEDDRVKDASYTGVGCALSQASASLMVDLIMGKTLQEATQAAEVFIRMIKSETTDEQELEILEDAMYLQNISKMPARVKCAVLAWHALREAIHKKDLA